MFDPMFSTATITRELAIQAFDHLVNHNENCQILPNLATSRLRVAACADTHQRGRARAAPDHERGHGDRIPEVI